MAVVRAALERIRSLPVGRKLVLIYAFGIFAPLLIANGLVLRGASIDTRRQEQLFLHASIENIAANIVREFEPLLLATEFVYADPLIYRLLALSYDSFRDFVHVHREQLMPALAKYVSVFPSVRRMIVYTDNPILRVAEGYLSLDAYSRSTEWFRRLEGSRPGLVAMVHTENDPRLVLEEQSVLSVFRRLDSPVWTGSGRLILRVDVNPALIKRALGASEIVGTVEVVDSNGTLVFARITGAAERSAYEFDDALSTAAALRGWRIRGSITPSRAVAPWSIRWTRLLVVSGVSLALSSVFIMMLSRSVTSRLSSLSRQMQKVEREDFTPLTMPHRSDDEIGRLIDDFNLMARKIDALINSGYKLEIERHQLLLLRRQAELSALQSQVNPHFLYNVLESIRMKSHLKGERETAAIVKKLSKAFRRITSWQDDLVPLGEEIAFTRDYLEIQQYRFGSKLHAEIDVDAATTSILIPKMTIQGLVENACVHGIERKSGGGRIAVTATRSADGVSIRVSDDGLGCDPGTVLAPADGRDWVSGHIGISNIRRRLALHFSGSFQFEFASRPGSGTTVRIDIAVPAEAGLDGDGRRVDSQAPGRATT